MKTYSRFLILMLLMWSSFASAAFDYNCIGKDKPLPPEPRTYTDDDGNTHDTDAFKSWKDTYGSNKQNWDCCNKLVLNASTRVCEDPSMTDSSLKECGGHGECTDGKGCYTREDDDLFNTEGLSEADAAAMAEKEKKFEEQQNSLGDSGDKEAGAACYRNMECESYQCKNFKCEAPPKICRLASNGDSAPGDIKCEEPLLKSQTTAICGGDVEMYSGLLGDIIVGPKTQQPGDPAPTRCEYQLYPTGRDPDGNPIGADKLEGAVKLGIRTIRSMEWLYSSVPVNNRKDCLYTASYMKDKMNKLIGQRKEILKAYNEDMLFIEENFNAIKGARLNVQDSQLPTLCADAGGGYEVTTEHDIASRKSTGLDFLCYMKERNFLYQEYEKQMKLWAAELQSYTSSYRDTVFNWGEKDKNWTTGDKSYSHSDRSCRDWPSWHKKIKRRWGERYKVKGSHDVNKGAVNMPGVSQYLTFLSDSNAPNSFNSGSYYLIDPMLPSGMGFGDFGASRNLNGTYDRTLGNGLGGFFNSMMAGSVGAALLGPVGFGIAIGMGGGNGSGLAHIYDRFDSSLVDYVKGLRADQPPEKFIYEPEIRGSYEMRGCIDRINQPECKRFREYLSDIKNFSFAQMLAYSRHHKTKYKKYFKEEGTWRRKLFARYDVDLVNLQKYYTALADLRAKQNACLDDVIKGLKTDFSTTEAAGVTTGLSNYYNATSSNYMGADGRDKNYNKPKVKGAHQTPKNFKLSALNFAFKGGGANKDGASGSNGAGSGSVGGAIVGGDALAARVKAMEAANAKAVAKGADLNGRAKELEENMAKAHMYASGGGANAGRGASGAASGAGSGSAITNKATLDGEIAKELADKDKAGKGKGAAAGAAGGANVGALSGVSSGSGSGDSSGSGAGDSSGSGSGQDASGMSDEEKDRMAANYDRTKGEYKPSEDDSLFQVLSKTYVRNLDKILTRKKKLDEENAALPAPQP